MAFIKEREIFNNGKTTVYINQCHAKGRKTNIYAVRRNDNTGLAIYLGEIRFNPRWRQYVFHPDKDTIWSSGCMKEITSFIDEINNRWRQKIQQRRKQT